MDSIEAVSNVSIPFTQILKVGYSGGRLSVPDNDPIGISARFKHITGVPLAMENGNIPYSKLQQLDLLIEQISKFKNQEMDIDVRDIERDQLQYLINSFSSELSNRLNSATADFYYGIYSPGSILNMSA